MTTRRLPLGRKETQRREFKARDSLEDRYAVGREVVGMLNAGQGGEIWVGLAEEEHRAVRVEPISDAEVEARSLQDFLMDSVEPAPLSEEIEVQVEKSDDGDEVLRIQAEGRAERRPYALLRRGGRYYVIRIGDRLRPMTREEILGTGKDGKQGRDEVIRRVLQERKGVLQKEEDLLWLRVEPTRPVTLELQAPLFDEIVGDPTRTDNRRTGSHFARSDHRPALGNGRLSWDLTYSRPYGEQRLSVEIQEQGGFEFRLPLSVLDSAERLPAGAKSAIAPLMLFEYLVSAFRIVRAVYTDPEAARSGLPEEIVVDLVLLGLEATVLMRERGWFPPDPHANPTYGEGRVFTLAGVPLVFPTSEVVDEPDHCGFRLVRKIYEAFGVREEGLPREFDRKTRRLILPE